MLTAAQLQANRDTAANLAKIQLGLDQTNPSDWTYDQRVAYDKAVAAIIAAHPDQFSSVDQATAKDVAQTDFSPLADTSFSFTDFGAAAVQPLADAAQSVGNGVFSVLGAAKWAIPLGVAVLAYMWFKSVNRKLGN